MSVCVFFGDQEKVQYMKGNKTSHVFDGVDIRGLMHVTIFHVMVLKISAVAEYVLC